MTNHILFIYNTRSGNHNLREEEIITKIESALKPSQTLTILKIDKKQQGNEELVRSLKKEKWDLVIVGGGDGTIRRLVAVMIEENFDFPMAILPLGSANGLATCLGVSDLDIAIEVLKRPSYIHMDVLCINDKISLHLSDFGFNAGLVKKFDESDSRGMMSYFKGSLSEFFANKPHRFHLIIDGKEQEVEARMLMIANGRMYGTGAVINPKGKLDDGKFEIIAFNPQGLNEVFNLSLNLFKGEIDTDRQVRTWQVDNAIIKNAENAQFQIDGDMEKEVSEVKVSVLKNRIKVLVLALTKDRVTAE
jgi:diacylglycerol kinase (ATP)